MSKRSHQRRKLRSQKGLLGVMMIIAVITVAVAIASFAYDIGHNVVVRSQLQSAADAGALAGAYDLCLSGGTGIPTPSPMAAETYSDVAASDAVALCLANDADGATISSSQVTPLPGQYSPDGSAPPNGFSSSYYMTVTVQKQILNLFATLYGRPYDTITVTSVAGPIGDPNAATSAISPFPIAIYSPNGGTGNHNWNLQGGLASLNVGILPMLTNGTTYQFVSGPTGLLGGVLGVAGLGGNANPTLQMMRYFDPSQSNTTAPPAESQGQTIMLLNPGLTGLNLTPLQAGPLTVENYFQSGKYNTSVLGLLNSSPSYTPSIAPFIGGKTFAVPVVTNPNVSILSMPLGSILKGGVAAQIVGFVPVTFSSSYAQPGTGLSAAGITVLPPNFVVSGTVASGAGAGGSNGPVPINVGLVQ